MKIQVISVHPLTDNRINKHLRTLINNGHYVEYVNASDSYTSEFELRDNISLTHYTKLFDQHDILRMVSIYLFLIKKILKTDADIVHIHDIYLLPLLVIAKLRGKMTIFDKHETFEKINGFYSKIFTSLETKIVDKIDGVVYTSEQQEEFIKRIGYKRSVHIPNYQSKLDYGSVDPQVRQSEKISIVYIGSLSEKDRQILLMLNVLEIVMSKNKNISCIIGGTIGQNSVRDKIEFLINDYKDQFEYVGYIPYSKVIGINKNSDIGLLFFKDDPNTYNSSSNKLYEYLLSGLAFVGVGKFILDDEITNCNAGKIFDFQTSKFEIAEYILQIADNKEKLRAIRNNAAMLGEKYSWESIEHRYVDLNFALMKENK